MSAASLSLMSRALPAAFAVYVVAVMLAHATLPAAWVWHIGFAALLGMLFTYPAYAQVHGTHLPTEVQVSFFFVLAGVIGWLFLPALLIAAIAAHGLLDAAKYFGAGAAVPVWYLIGCACFDFAYAAYLTTFL